MISCRMKHFLLAVLLAGMAACPAASTPEPTPNPTGETPAASPETSPVAHATATPRPPSPAPSPAQGSPTPAAFSQTHADVLAVNVAGDPGSYTFAVTLHSPDTGCDNYADWWEVLDEQGALVFRRILNHSHPDEQPFTRSGGPVPAQPDQKLIVRGHMNTTGYGGRAMSGTVAAGFQEDASIGSDFAPGVGEQDPQPTGCAF